MRDDEIVLAVRIAIVVFDMVYWRHRVSGVSVLVLIAPRNSIIQPMSNIDSHTLVALKSAQQDDLPANISQRCFRRECRRIIPSVGARGGGDKIIEQWRSFHLFPRLAFEFLFK